jgi:hypothetical protein
MGLLRHHPSIGKLRLATGAQPRPLARMPLMVDMTTIALFLLRSAPRPTRAHEPQTRLPWDKFDGRGTPISAPVRRF